MKNKKVLEKRKMMRILASFFLLAGLFSSCSDKNDTPEYDPNKPIVLDDFNPKTGGMMEGIIISGSNFGSNPKDIKVYFNKKQAVITGVSEGGKIQALAPRLPGDICDISVVIGEDSVTFTDKYNYIKNYNLSVLCGQVGSTTDKFVEGSLASTEYTSSLRYLTMAPNGLLYVGTGSEKHYMSYMNEKDNFTRPVLKPHNSAKGTMGGVYVPELKRMAFVGATEGYLWDLDPDDPVDNNEKLLLLPSDEKVKQGYVKPVNPFAWFYSFVYTKYTRPGDPLGPIGDNEEGFIYTRVYSGMLVRFKLSDRITDMVLKEGKIASDVCLSLDPDGTKIYSSKKQSHEVTVIDLSKTSNDPDFEKTIIGGIGKGHMDGHTAIAQVNQPQAILVTNDKETGKKIMYIADTGNRCVRKYDFETEMVSTIAGTAGQKGLVTGNPEHSKMDNPVGLAINSDGDLYISDSGNRVILKLSFQ